MSNDEMFILIITQPPWCDVTPTAQLAGSGHATSKIISAAVAGIRQAVGQTFSGNCFPKHIDDKCLSNHYNADQETLDGGIRTSKQ